MYISREMDRHAQARREAVEYETKYGGIIRLYERLLQLEIDEFLEKYSITSKEDFIKKYGDGTIKEFEVLEEIREAEQRQIENWYELFNTFCNKEGRDTSDCILDWKEKEVK